MYYQQDTEIKVLLSLYAKLENKTFIDVGAEKGSLIRTFLDAGCKTIYAFEPYPPNVTVLKQQFQADSGVHIFDVALGPHDDTARLHIAEDKSGHDDDTYHSLRVADDTATIHWAGTIEVRVRSLESLIAEGAIPGEIGILKIDTVGFDFAVLQGMGRLASPVVMMEYWADLPDTVGTCPYQLGEVADLMRGRGYSNYAFVKRWDEFETIELNSPPCKPGEWGNVLFFHDSQFPQLTSIVYQAVTAAQAVLVDKAVAFRLECQRRLEVVEKLEQVRIRQDEANHFLKEALRERSLRNLPRTLLFRLREATIRRIFPAARLGILHQYDPRPMKIPRRYQATLCNLTAPPCISIVTPSFNQGVFIERTIESVVGQKYPRLEYIVQDGGSTDSTPQVLEKFHSKLSYVESVKDSGQANAINRGFGHATGEIMAYLNSDDLLLPGTLAYVANYFGEHPEIDVVYGHRIVIDQNDQEVGRWVLPPHDDGVITWVDYIPQETLFWRRKIWEKVGGNMDESFHFALDWDLLLRFRAAGAHFARLPRFLGAFRVHAEQKTTAQLRDVGESDMARLRERTHGRSVTNTEIKTTIQPYLNKHRVYHRFYQWGILRY